MPGLSQDIFVNFRIFCQDLYMIKDKVLFLHHFRIDIPYHLQNLLFFDLFFFILLQKNDDLL